MKRYADHLNNQPDTIGLPGCCWTWPLVALAVIAAWVVGRAGG